jgi:hypothetical protein
VRDIENEYTRGMNSYPATLSATYDYLVNYRPDGRAGVQDPDLELSYYTDDGTGQGGCSGGQGGSRGNQGGRGGGRRHNPGRSGTGGDTALPAVAQGRVHFEHGVGSDDAAADSTYLLDNLDQVEEYSFISSAINLVDHHSFAGYTRHSDSSTTILLDSCSTVNLIVNHSLLQGIHQVPTTMNIPSVNKIASY